MKNEQCSINLDEWTIHMATRENRIDVTELLLENGVDINARDEQGDTAAHIAAEANSSDVLMVLFLKIISQVKKNDLFQIQAIRR